MRFLLTLFLLISTAWAQVVVYPNGNVAATSTHFTVVVSTHSSPVYQSNAGSCSSGECGTEAGKTFSYTIFNLLSGSATITVTKLSSSATSCTLRPGGTVLTPTLSGGNASISYTISSQQKTSIEFSDDPTLNHACLVDCEGTPTSVIDTTALHIYTIPPPGGTRADSIAVNNIPVGTTGISFSPGVKYKVGKWTIPSGVTQVYYWGGTFVSGYMYSTAGNKLINGFGIVSGSGYPWHYGGSDYNSWDKLIEIHGTNTISVQNVTFADATAPNILISGASPVINRINIIAWNYNNDGVTYVGGSGVFTVENSFLRTHDDTFVPFVNNCVFYNNIVWQLSGKTVQLGYVPQSLSNFVISNNDVIHDEASNPLSNIGFVGSDYTGISSGAVTISNFVISNNTFETPILRFIDLRSHLDISQVQPVIYKNFVISGNRFKQSVSAVNPFMYFYGFDLPHLSDYPVFSGMNMNRIYAVYSDYNNPLYFNHQYLSGSGGIGFKVPHSAKVKN
jgi:hypothetical protein